MRAVLEHGLARRIRVGQHRGVDVDHHLIALARRSGVEGVVQRRLGQQGERVSLLLREGRRLRGNVLSTRVCAVHAALLIQGLAGSGKRLNDHRARLGREPPADHHHAVLILIHVQGTALVSSGLVVGFGLAVHSAPAAHDALDVAGGAGAPDCQQALFRLQCGDASQRAHLRVRELAPLQGLGQSRQACQRTRHPHALARRAQVEPHAPAQPGRARAESGVPALAGVEFADELQQASGGGVEVGRQLGDLIAESIEWSELMACPPC